MAWQILLFALALLLTLINVVTPAKVFAFLVGNGGVGREVFQAYMVTVWVVILSTAGLLIFMVWAGIAWPWVVPVAFLAVLYILDAAAQQVGWNIIPFVSEDWRSRVYDIVPVYLWVLVAFSLLVWR